ncbi:TonB-dependent receptor [Alteraurantiacibacter buctensis]|uniref:TonB-dependent receptor n=1 Tax=Alteraurantiacibacter buctensis TaxID=1503981 RepID=A0A844YVF8_9SPHN|nr:TonB-dependent receptor [Alteraurantiacibacter buctensis]MXO71036.1 TonB-dependent receptor [Alteraurantiacibacter buctensis]
MKIKYFLAASLASIATATVIAPPVMAQQTTTAIEGTVIDDLGNPVANATITITDERTGVSRTFVTGATGSFNASGLVAGGPYSVTAAADGFEGQTVSAIQTSLQGATSLTFTLSSGGGVITVTANRVQAVQVATGPGLAFNTETMEAFPSINRDVRDIIRIDPRVSLDREGDVDRISCLGGNDRTNTFTVDGVTQADSFGLNGTPFASRNALPLPFDVIRETSVEFAPFDVEYSDFTGCLVNVVTKSGANDFHGSAFFTFRDENLRGSTVDGQDFTPAPFSEKRWGATLSGPIIEDRLFFFVGYEQTDLGDSNDFGPAGGGFASEARFVNQATFDQFAQIANSVYGQDIGGYPRSLPESSVRYFARVDAYIAENHRLELSYQRLEEENVYSDTGSNELTGFNSYGLEGTLSNYYSGRLFSDWTDRFSTELRVSRSVVHDRQDPVGFGEAQSDAPTVRLVVGVRGAGADGISGNADDVNGLLSTGPGLSRSANQLDTELYQYKFQANYVAGDHVLKIGAELNDLEVFNLFAQNATGTLFFRNLADFQQGLVAASSGTPNAFGSADDLASGINGGALISATGSGDITDAGALFNRRIWSLYAQDEWQATDQLSVIAGARLQWYEGSAPRENPNFIARYGFSNAVSFSDLDPIFLPRLGLTYEVNDEGFMRNTVLKGGIGAFSGGDPVVYFSNAFSNNGYSTGTGTSLATQCAGLRDANGQFDVVTGGSFTGMPACVIAAAQAQSAAGLADTQSTDPNFKVPTVWRANLGFETEFGAGGGFFDNWRANVDYVYSHFVDPLNFVDLSQVVDTRLGAGGYTVDGRPIYRAIDPTRAGCTARLIGTGGTPPRYTNVNTACFGTSRDDEIQLTNGPSYDSHIVSAILSKTFGGGVFTENGSTAVSFGYAFTDSNNFRNANSSTATSSFDESGEFDRNNPDVGTSNYETRHRFTAAFNFRDEFFEEYSTQLGLFFSAQSGRPYTLTFDGGSSTAIFMDTASGSDNARLYIPTGPNDPNLSPSSNAAAVASLISYLDDLGCADGWEGRTIGRNTCTEDWVYDLDMRISQEVPGPGRFFGLEDRIELFADIDNVLNIIDSSWNTQRSRGVFGDGQIVDLVDGNFDALGRYVITDFNPDDQERINTSASAWRIQIGARYEF